MRGNLTLEWNPLFDENSEHDFNICPHWLNRAGMFSPPNNQLFKINNPSFIKNRYPAVSPKKNNLDECAEHLQELIRYIVNILGYQFDITLLDNIYTEHGGKKEVHYLLPTKQIHEIQMKASYQNWINTHVTELFGVTLKTIVNMYIKHNNSCGKAMMAELSTKLKKNKTPRADKIRSIIYKAKENEPGGV